MRRPRCPRVFGSRFHRCHGPRCRLLQLRSPTHPFDHQNHENLTLLDGCRMVAELEPRAGSAPSPIPARWASVASDQTRTTRITTHHPATNASQPGRRPSGGHRAAEARSIKDRAFSWRIHGAILPFVVGPGPATPTARARTLLTPALRPGIRCNWIPPRRYSQSSAPPPGSAHRRGPSPANPSDGVALAGPAPAAG